MSWSLKLFRIRDIDVKVHLTFVFILVWAAYRWGTSTGQGWLGALFGVVVTLLLFAAVTLHELGHSFQALKYGVGVRGITLMPMGGMAEMEAIPQKPIQELRIALAGPLVNFTIFALLVGLSLILQAEALLTPGELRESLGQASWAGTLAYLTAANLLLGLFNLIPAFPMDGGRVLRALLALRLDYRLATKIAVRVGQGLALLLGLWGFMSGGFTLILVAIFVWLGAEGEGKQVELEGVLRDLTVAQAMTRQPQVLAPDEPLARAVELTLSTAQTDFPVIEPHSGQLTGLLTENDLLAGLRSQGGQESVGRVMHSRFPIAAPGELMVVAQQHLRESRLHALPVVERDGRLVGLLTADDINEAFRLLAITRRPAPQPN
jgi:Zn-dependent protease/predicted transcriptional regulator